MKKIYYLIIPLLFVASAFSTQANAQKPVAGDISKIIEMDGVDIINPKWSPDGSKIAFTSANQTGLWVADANGDNIQQITDDESVGFGFSWSYDSSYLLARHSVQNGPRRIHAVKLYSIETGGATELTDYRNQMPAVPVFSANQQQVLLPLRDRVETLESGLQLRIKTIPTGEATTQPVVLNSRSAIQVATDQSDSYNTLVPFEGRTFLNATPSPDGQRIAFEVMGGNLYIMNTDGSGIVDLGRANRPEWSPDGRYLAAMLAEDDGYQMTQSDIVAFTTDGSECLYFTTSSGLIAMNPSWSPDGSKIAFHAANESGIFVLELITE
jgi:Tol biopolymer transport system component